MKNFFKYIYIIGRIPQIDWLRVLFVTIILVIFICIYGYIYHNKITSENIDVTVSIQTDRSGSASSGGNSQNASSGLNIYDRNGNNKLELREIIEMYKAKKDLYQKMLSQFKR